MHSKNSMLRDVALRVQAPTTTGETLCITGNTPELGGWEVSRALPFTRESEISDIWTLVIQVPVDTTVHFRYIIVMIVEPVQQNSKFIVRRWETNVHHRHLMPTDTYTPDYPAVHCFGSYDGKEQIEPGWLTSESVVQLKLYNNPITIWKQRYNRKPFSLKVTTIDLERHNSETVLYSENNTNDSSLYDSTHNTGWPVVEVSVMNENDFGFKPQEQFGHIYNPEEYIVFQTRMLKPETIAYMIDLYVLTGDIPEHMGFCYILPGNFHETSGVCTMPISGKHQQPIGQMIVSYLLVKPLKGFACDCRKTYAKHWPKQRGLDVGHRGAGNARRTDKVENVLENTVASFNYAAKHGADMVELDVQLTKDHVPVIYHDYYICIAMKKKKINNDHEMLELAVKDLTAEQLQMLTLRPAKNGSHSAHDFHDDDHEDNQPFPTLKHVLKSVDPHIGFNIEIKCPMQLRDGTWEMSHMFELNTYIDIILKDILENAGDRYIILSCFHPDICTLVRLKQNKYPLLFLTQGQTDRYPPYLDTRTSSIAMATYFARSIGILGISVHAEDLIRDYSLINFVKNNSLVLFCWGEDINHPDIIKTLKEYGVDGVIYDKVDELNTAKEHPRLALLAPEDCNNGLMS